MKLMCKVATTPSLRDTSLQGEAFRLPLRGAVGNADRGVVLSIIFSILSYLLSATRDTDAPFPYFHTIRISFKTGDHWSPLHTTILHLLRRGGHRPPYKFYIHKRFRHISYFLRRGGHWPPYKFYIRKRIRHISYFLRRGGHRPPYKFYIHKRFRHISYFLRRGGHWPPL